LTSAGPPSLARPTPTLLNRQPKLVEEHGRSTLVSALLGVLGVVAAPFYVAHFGFSLLDAALFIGMYWPTYGLGICVGHHRHFSHGAFKASRRVRWVLAVLGAMGGQGPVTYWAATHRRHHAHSDVKDDPHTPNLHGDGIGGAVRGLWHGHFGWAFDYGLPNASHYCPDIVREPSLTSISRRYPMWVAFGLVLPTLVGWLVMGTLQGALAGLLWGGLVRLFVSSHSTWSLNSICHYFGSRPYPAPDRSTNVAWLALPTLGESWHNNHHAFPSSAVHGLRWWQLDVNYLSICMLERLGLVHDVKRATRRPRKS
jgi:stearoyl-CoA desaturase (delta-9 desaturase)